MSREIQHQGGRLVAVDNPYDVAGYLPGLPDAAAIVFAYLPPRDITFPSGLTGSRGKASIAATATATYSIKKNGSEIGTMQFAAAGTVPTFAMASTTTITETDELTVVAPVSQDGTLAGVRFTLAGTR